jgi:hypothetical protein
MIAIAVTETRIQNDAPRVAVRSFALISCASNSVLGILGLQILGPSKIAAKGFGYPAFEDDGQCGL